MTPPPEHSKPSQSDEFSKRASVVIPDAITPGRGAHSAIDAAGFAAQRRKASPAPELLQERIEELEDELGRVKAERDELSEWYGKAETARRETHDRLRDTSRALRRLVNAGLPVDALGIANHYTVDLDPDRPFWVAARNARATLTVHAEVTGIDGEQDPR